MSNILAQICDTKRLHVAQQKYDAPLADIKAIANDQPHTRGFLNALNNAPFPAIIAEIKKASPSKGIIRTDFNPTDIAQIYQDNGAACLSVLTDAPYFQGNDDIFRAVRPVTILPMLRKDFMVDLYQIHESRALGADCVLLIMAALEDNQAQDMHETARELGMDVLVETHNEEEIHRALQLTPHILGVNNRNLKTMDVTIDTSQKLAEIIPSTIHKTSESGLKNFDTLQELQEHGYNSFLIGETLMKQPNIADALRAIRSA